MSSDGKGILQLMDELKAALDEHDRLTQPMNFDDPRVLEQDIKNGMLNQPEEDKEGG